MQISLDLAPIPCPRPRIRLIKSKSGRSFASAYYPRPYTIWQVEAAELLAPHAPEVPLEGPLMLEVTFYVERPRTSKLLVPKGDVDNYVKSLMDALTKAEFWNDDSQVAYLVAKKQWAVGRRDGITFNIMPMRAND